jgi:hypothetical protein
MSAEDLRDSVRDYRNPATSTAERREIGDWWKSQGIPNQFAAMLRAADIARATENRH